MTTRIPCLDGLRGIAPIAVMEFHFAILFLPQAKLFDILPGLDRAYLAVDLFFMIAAFVMAQVYGQQLALDWRGHWLKFGIARFARLYQAFAATTLQALASIEMAVMLVHARRTREPCTD